MKANLQKYRSKRDFGRTGEPAGSSQHKPRKREGSRFVIQKHQARNLHFDFRLEMDGVLKSWAVPKAIPTVKGERRLAMEVEDHPIEYGRFEGIIPPGNYGAGTVQLWDRGLYEVIDGRPSEGWNEGKLSLVLHGKKLQGQWTMVRTRGGDESHPAWLLIKTKESLRKLSSQAAAKSVKSGKTMTEISRSRTSWNSASQAKAPGKTAGFKARVQKLASRKHR